MKELLIRALSGVLYILVLVVSIYNPTILKLTFFVFGVVCLSELNKLLNINSKVTTIIIYTIYVVLYGALIFLQSQDESNFLYKGSIVFCSISLIINILLIKNLYSKNKSLLNISNKIILITFYCSAAFLYLNLIPYFKEGYNPELLLGYLILIWTNDTFAYIVGRLIGRRKFFESVSPNKTIEGFLGGVCFTIIAGYILSMNYSILQTKYWLILSLILSIVGAFGDLVESKMKRLAHVKDSGSIMPGHGGLLDRLDSIIFTTPFSYMFLMLLEHVF